MRWRSARCPSRIPEELVEIRLPDEDLEIARGSFERYPAMTHPLWERLRDRQSALSDVSPGPTMASTWRRPARCACVRGLWVSGDFFSALGVTPAVGRLLSPSDDRRGYGLPGAVVSHDFWQRELAGNPSLAGRTLTVNRHRVDVIGVRAAGVLRRAWAGVRRRPPHLLDHDDSSTANRLDSGTSWWLTVMGRLKPGWSVERADAHTRAISPAMPSRRCCPSDYPAVSVKAAYLASKLTTHPSSGGVSGLA